MAAILPVPGDDELLMVTIGWDTSTLTVLTDSNGLVCTSCCGDSCEHCTGVTPSQIELTISGLASRALCENEGLEGYAAQCGFGMTSRRYTSYDLASILNGNTFTLDQSPTDPCEWKFQVFNDCASATLDIFSGSDCDILGDACLNDIDFTNLSVTKGISSVTLQMSVTVNGLSVDEWWDRSRMTQTCSAGECVDDCSGTQQGIVGGPVDTSAASFTIDAV